MRAWIITSTLLVLSASPARAYIGRPPVYTNPPPTTNLTVTSLRIVNQSDHAVQVQVTGLTPFALEPASSSLKFFNGGVKSVTVQASVLGSPGVSDSEVAQLQSGKSTLVNISTNSAGTSLTVTALKPGATASISGREARVALASTGGLLPLLLLGVLLGRRPQGRQLGAALGA